MNKEDRLLEETTVTIKTEDGDIERPAMISDNCPGLAIVKTSFARFGVTHINSGTKIGLDFRLFGDAFLLFSKLALIAKDQSFTWDIDQNSVPEIMKEINDSPVPFDSTVVHLGKERKQTCKEFFQGLRYYDLHSFLVDEPDREEEAFEMLEACGLSEDEKANALLSRTVDKIDELFSEGVG